MKRVMCMKKADNPTIFPCVWNETKNNPDWFYCTCINSKINVWKLCKKKHITMVQLFQNCPYCGKRVVLK